MPPTRSNPIGLSAVGSVDFRPFRDAIKSLVRRVNDADDANRGWLDKQARMTKLRFGTRKRRSIPWKGASNLTIPLIDKTIRRWRPSIVSLVLDADPAALFTPQEATDFDTARGVEPFFTWMFREQMRTTREVVHHADLLAQRGFSLCLEGWAFKTRKQVRVVRGDEIIPEGLQQLAGQAAQLEASPLELVLQRIANLYEVDPQSPGGQEILLNAAQPLLQGAEYSRLISRKQEDDRPDWKALDPVNVIFPIDQIPEEGDFLAVVHKMSPQMILNMAVDGTFIPEQANEHLRKLKKGQGEFRPENTPADDVRETIRRIRDKQAEIESETRKNRAQISSIWQLFAYIDVDGDGLDERVIIWYAPGTDTVLQFFEFPFPFDLWPVTTFEFNVDSPRVIDNRGIPEMIASWQKIASAMHNARIDASTIVLAPAFKQRSLGGDYKKSIQWRPGAIFPVTHVDDITPIVHDLRILAPLLTEQQVGASIAEDYVGTFDATIGRLQDQNAPERRTATEVSAIQNVAASVFGLDAKLYTDAMSRSFNKIWNLFEEWGEPELFFRVQGEQAPRVFKKSEVARNYDIRAAGTPANTQKQLLLNNYNQVLQLAFNDRSGLLNLPVLLQAWLKLIDPIIAGQAVRPVEESAQVQAIQQAANIATEGEVEFGAL